MFISRILKTVSSLEPDLESHRAMLFEVIKECDDFPYGLKSDLSTLTSTVTKAATDIVLAAQRIESEKSLGVYNLRTEVRLLKDSP